LSTGDNPGLKARGTRETSAKTSVSTPHERGTPGCKGACTKQFYSGHVITFPRNSKKNNELYAHDQNMSGDMVLQNTSTWQGAMEGSERLYSILWNGVREQLVQHHSQTCPR
jgi:hypothetical protein